MKPFRVALTLFLVFFAFVLPSNGCGPFFPEAVFVQTTRPDGNYADYAKGRLGVPQDGYRTRHLAIAYAWLNGTGLTAEEQKQAIAVDQLFNPTDVRETPAHGDGISAWIDARIDARKSSGVPGGPQDVPAQPNQPWTAKAAIDSIPTEHNLPGEQYSSFTNCLDDGFANAAQTLAARKTAHGADQANFANWVHGQDAVFANCGSGNTLPPAAAADAPLWLKQDRAYQTAAAKFYQMDYDGAIVILKTIAADSASPWHETARLVMARAMLRRGTLGQITEVPPALLSPNQGPAHETADRDYQALVVSKRTARLTEARDALRAMVADPAMQRYHASAAGLLDYTMLRLDPTTQQHVLAKRLTAQNRPQTPGVYGQALVDLTFLHTQAVQQPSAASNDPKPDNNGLNDWIATFAQTAGDTVDYRFSTPQAKAAQQALHTAAAQHALDVWHSTHALPWLVAALSTAQPGDASTTELVAAAQAVPTSSNAWVAVTYHRLRLTGNAAASRTELDALLPKLTGTQSRSTVNLFTTLRLHSAPTLTAFLQDAGTVPAGTTTDTDEPDPLSKEPTMDALCGTGKKTSETEVRLFDHDASTILNTRMPLRLLAAAADDPSLPPNLRFQIAQSTWARAVLLQQPELAKRMTPVLTGCYPAWKPFLDRYDASNTPDDRRANGLLALMRFASTEPLVRDGEQRNEGFATYSNFRDNWWRESSPGKPADNQPPTFFGTSASTRVILPDPPFLTAEDRTQAEAEVAKLRTIPCASDYFATAALDWQSQHPSDLRTADILGFAERVIRNGCSTDKTSELNHKLFELVQSKYPNSEWARKYKTWG